MQRLGSRRQRTADTGDKQKALEDAKQLSHLKLYQPAHMRYYLVTACLTCQIVGLPDRKVEAGKQERVGFVMRGCSDPRSQSPEKIRRTRHTGRNTPGEDVGRLRVAKRATPTQTKDAILLDDEERLPLFPRLSRKTTGGVAGSSPG